MLTDNLNRQLGPVVRTCWHILDLAEGEHAINDFTKDDMLAVQEVAFLGCDEELGGHGYEQCNRELLERGAYLAAVCVWARVGLY
jgi:hypothetical protein